MISMICEFYLSVRSTNPLLFCPFFIAMAPLAFSKKAISENDLVDLHGKVVLVTGGK